MKKLFLIALLAMLCVSFGVLLSCGASSSSSSGKSAVICDATTKATCVATDSDNGYGKCVWANNACTAPTVATSCATYTDEASCTATCTWTNGACTGSAGGSGLPCSNYTTQVACEIPCSWNGTACVAQ